MVIDTSVFIEFLRVKDKTKTTLYSIVENKQLFISSITLYELYMGATTHEKKNDIIKLTGDLPVLAFDEIAAKKAADIYHDLRVKNKMIGFRDIFIGATCLVYEMPVKTINKKDFERIDGINIE